MDDQVNPPALNPVTVTPEWQAAQAAKNRAYAAQRRRWTARIEGTAEEASPAPAAPARQQKRKRRASKPDLQSRFTFYEE